MLMSPWIVALFAGYAAAVASWFAIDRLFPGLWRQSRLPTFSHPWREVLAALLAAGGVLLLGQLWLRGVRLPIEGTAGTLTESLNQVLIFSPFFVLLLLRHQPMETALIPMHRLGSRLLVGVLIALMALGVHLVVRRAFGEDVFLFPRILQFRNLDEAVQVLLEDIAIAIFLVRFAAAMGSKTTIACVAALFAAGHIPAMVAQGASSAELAGLARDVLLGVMVLGTILRSRDIVWFWPVHLVMDLTQFSQVMGVAP
jgi:hypothetical protein